MKTIEIHSLKKLPILTKIPIRLGIKMDLKGIIPIQFPK
jgi:hypothetical protein